jgi:hypothetical protein
VKTERDYVVRVVESLFRKVRLLYREAASIEVKRRRSKQTQVGDYTGKAQIARGSKKLKMLAIPYVLCSEDLGCPTRTCK